MCLEAGTEVDDYTPMTASRPPPPKKNKNALRSLINTVLSQNPISKIDII